MAYFAKKRRTKRDLLSQRLTFIGYFWIKSYKIKPREVIPRGLLKLLSFQMCDFTGIWEKWHPIGILEGSSPKTKPNKIKGFRASN
jgi:hypothetical protein